MQFRPPPHPRSEPRAQPIEVLEVTVVVRCIPLVTAAYGTRVARPARTTMLPPGGGRSQPGRSVRPILGEPLVVGKNPEGSRRWHQDLNGTRITVAGGIPGAVRPVSRTDAAAPSHPVLTYPWVSRRPVSNLVSIGVPISSGRGRPRAAILRNQGSDRPAGDGKADPSDDRILVSCASPPMRARLTQRTVTTAKISLR